MGFSVAQPTIGAGFQELADNINQLGDDVNGQATSISGRSDVFERTLLEMVGIDSNDATSLHTGESKKQPETYFIDMNGLSDEQAQTLVTELNSRYGEGTITEAQAFEGFERSFQLPLDTTLNTIMNDVDVKLDELGQTNPAFIRELQAQSGRTPNFGLNEEEREVISPTTPGKQGFGDITPMVEARTSLEGLIQGISDTNTVDLQTLRNTTIDRGTDGPSL